jgi:hypothetical protein
MKLKELITLLKGASGEGASIALSGYELLKDQITKADAYRSYGRTNVDRWITEGLLKISKKSIDKTKLESVADSSNRITYLPVAER